MKANELRIGNLLQGEPISLPKLNIYGDGVMAITGEGISLIERGILNNINPIPLTEKWLLKFGFEKHGWRSQNWFLGLRIHRVGIPYIRFVKKIFWLYFTGESPVKVCEIRYVHQLQNLYFALTGEEL